MPTPTAVELQLSPSCYSCLSWSEDGELAMAAGEYVQILVSAPNPTNQTHSTHAHTDTPNRNPRRQRKLQPTRQDQHLARHAHPRQSLRQQRVADHLPAEKRALLHRTRAVPEHSRRTIVVAAGAGSVPAVCASCADVEFAALAV